jgi:hypothetical protein
MGKLVMFLIAGAMVPYLLGMLFTRFFLKKEQRLCANLVLGYIMIWAFLQVILIPSIYLKLPFHVIRLIVGILAGVLSVASLIVNGRRIWELVKSARKSLGRKHWILAAAIVLIAAQTCYISRTVLGDDDDAFYVATASTAVETDTLMEINPYTGDPYSEPPSRYVLSPFPIYVALMSSFVGVRAVTMAHTLLPICLIPLAYMIYYMLACQLYDDNVEKKGIFLLLVMAVLSFSGYSVYTQGVFMFTRIWQGKAVLAALLVPLILYWGLRSYMGELTGAEWVSWAMVMLSACFVSSMGIMLGMIMSVLTGIVVTLLKRKGRYLRNTILCCIPNILYAVLYVIIR